ncbi:MAG: hypothetical protein U0Q07_03070 [Acidimicrobiales bacterium]
MSETDPTRDAVPSVDPPSGAPTTTDAATSGSTPTAAKGGAGEDVPTNPLDVDDDESFLSWKLLVAVVVVLAVVAVGAFALVSGRKKDETGAKTGTSTPSAQELPTIRDDFDRPDNATTLGKTATGEDWEAVTGTWGVKDKAAYVAAKNPNGPRNMAVVDLGTGDGAVQAKAAKLVDGWGLAFRVRGPNAWFALKAAPKAGTFNIVKFKDGQETKVDNIGLTKLTDDTTVRVEFNGKTITVFLNNNPVRTIEDADFATTGTKAGLFADGAAVAEGRWNDFKAVKGVDGPPVTAAPKPGTPGQGEGNPKSSSTTVAGQGGTAKPKAPGGSAKPTTTTSSTP